MNFMAGTIVILSSFAIAITVILKEIMHCNMLKNADYFISQIKNRAMYLAEPLPDIIKNLSESNNKLISEFCLFFEAKSDLKKDVAPDIWKVSVDNFFGKHLYPYECDILKHFGENICSCNKEEINQIYTKAHNDLCDFLSTAEEVRKTRTRSTAAISISSGLMLVLMFI